METLGNLALDRGMRYVNLDDNLRSLERKLQRLSSRKSDFELQVMNAERSGTEKRKREVEIWFEEVVEIENEFNALKASIEQGGFVQNAISSGDRVAKMDATVEELMEQSNHFDGLLLEKFESRGERRVTIKLISFEKICAWVDTELREIGNMIKAALEVGASLAPGDSRFDKLIKERDQGIAEENGVLPNKLSEAPIVVDTADAIPKVAEPAISMSNQTTTLSSAKPKYRHEYYQKPDQVVVTIFAKGVPAKTVSVDFGEQILSVTIDVPGEDAYSFQPRLFGKIIPANCRYEVLSTKIEIRLAKAEAVHWASLEYSRDNVALQRINVPSGGQRPTYPSSKATKDWDKLEALVKKEEKDEKLDGDAALNKFFRDIYKDADEDTRRAMMKSFVESNGTVLSTNWKEVGAKKVEGSPPDGMEMKKWEI